MYSHRRKLFSMEILQAGEEKTVSREKGGIMMAILTKKNKNGVVRKVQVKMSCSCNGCRATCICSCSSTAAFVSPHGDVDASWCASAYYDKLERIERNVINQHSINVNTPWFTMGCLNNYSNYVIENHDIYKQGLGIPKY